MLQTDWVAIAKQRLRPLYRFAGLRKLDPDHVRRFATVLAWLATLPGQRIVPGLDPAEALEYARSGVSGRFFVRAFSPNSTAAEVLAFGQESCEHGHEPWEWEVLGLRAELITLCRCILKMDSTASLLPLGTREPERWSEFQQRLEGLEA